MIKGKQTRPSRICFECTHYEACQAWNVGTLVETDATHCVNYRASVGKTNADRIRSMADEELAEFLYNAWDNAAWCSDKRCTEDDSCLPCWLKWLREECNE